MRLHLSIAIALLWSAACYAQSPNPFFVAHNAAIKAMADGKYRDAKTAYSDVISLARQSRMDPLQLSEYLYQAGQATALACAFDEAEKQLTEAVDLAERREQTTKGQSEFFSVTWKLFELAHFYSDRQLYAKAFPYWKKFVPRYEELNKTAARDPIAYAMVLKEYGRSAAAIGDQPLAEKMLRESARLEQENAELFTRIAWYKYGRNCK